MTELNIHKVLEYLPHRYPFLMVDRVLDYTIGEKLTAIKNVTINEPFFQGHFPYRPVMPGVLMLESMVQAAAILASLGLDAKSNGKRLYYFVGIDKARFKRPVEPGDQFVIQVKLEREIRSMWKCAVTGSVDDNLCCTASVMFTYKDNE